MECDEVHPRCGNCSRHGVSCDFESSESPISGPTPNGHNVDASINSPHSYSTSSPESQGNATVVPFSRTPLDIVRSNANSAASRALELKLMHHFTANTAKTFSDFEEQKNAWQVVIPTLAYDSQYLMDAILAVSALHMRALHPDDHTLIRASHSYMASALAQYSSLLRGGVSEQNAEALFATSALIAFQASASRRFEEAGNYNLPVVWFHSFQGVKTVVMASWLWLRSSSKVFPIINSQPALSLNLDPERNSFFAPLLDGIEEQISQIPEEERGETKRSYEHAVAFLNWAHKKPDRARILGFAATVSRRFVELIAEHDPRALVIISCFFAMTKVVDDVWWLHGLAKREVTGIFGLVPQEWRGKMEWSYSIANHEGPMEDTVWGGSWALEVKNEATITAHIDILAEIMNQSVPPLPPD